MLEWRPQSFPKCSQIVNLCQPLSSGPCLLPLSRQGPLKSYLKLSTFARATKTGQVKTTNGQLLYGKDKVSCSRAGQLEGVDRFLAEAKTRFWCWTFHMFLVPSREVSSRQVSHSGLHRDFVNNPKTNDPWTLR